MKNRFKALVAKIIELNADYVVIEYYILGIRIYSSYKDVNYVKW